MSGPGAGPASRPGTGPVLAVDTATTHAVVALGDPDGTLRAARTWAAGYRHGEELLPAVEALLRDEGLDRHELAGLIVGTGPGAFTGLRVGIATVKGLAHALGLPVAGVPTSAALIEASGVVAGVLLQPAGPSDRVMARAGEAPVLLSGGTDPELRPGETLVAVDLDGRAEAGALALGEAARGGLAAALVRQGAARLGSGDADDLATLVPEYVTLPRGVREVAAGGVSVTGDAR